MFHTVARKNEGARGAINLVTPSHGSASSLTITESGNQSPTQPFVVALGGELLIVAVGLVFRLGSLLVYALTSLLALYVDASFEMTLESSLDHFLELILVLPWNLSGMPLRFSPRSSPRILTRSLSRFCIVITPRSFLQTTSFRHYNAVSHLLSNPIGKRHSVREMTGWFVLWHKGG